jgi:hypothetical protein
MKWLRKQKKSEVFIKVSHLVLYATSVICHNLASIDVALITIWL